MCYPMNINLELDWASLSNQEFSTLFMDNTSGNSCVSTHNLDAGGQWKVVLRKGIFVQKFLQQR